MKRPWVSAPFLALAAAAATAGCTPLGTGGELGNGGFMYVCSSDSDLACEDADMLFLGETLVPNALAVGSRFDLTYNGQSPETEDGTSFAVTVVPASPFMVEASSAGFRLQGAGAVAFLGRGADGTVADFLHVQASVLHHIDVTRDGSQATAVSLDASARVALHAIPKEDGDQTLGGALSYAWSSSDLGIVSISTSLDDNDATIEGVSAGSAVVSVSVGGVRTDIPVTVEATP